MKKAGMLMPVFSLPGKYGIGTLGEEAYKFIDMLCDTGNKIWQVLPMGPTGFGDSPYQSFSAFAGNPYFIDLQLLVKEGLLSVEELEEFDFGDGRVPDQYGGNPEDIQGDSPYKVNYGKLYISKTKALKLAFEHYLKQGGDVSGLYEKLRPETVEYCVFMAIKDSFKGASWDVWPRKFRNCDAKELELFRKTHKEEIGFYAFLQYQFMKQWGKVHEYAKIRGIEIVGDIPIYCAPDSSDVWAHRELFQYTSDGEPKKVAGVPPDLFSATGQLWGNPLYDWDMHEKTGYKWWLDRMDYCFEMFDILRVDHFRGFESYYSIPFGDKTAENGEWVKGPGMSLFDAMYEHYGTKKLPIIAEDLGIITDEVRELMDKVGFPGMKVLQFAWDSGPENAFLPNSLVTTNCIYYTGTHDNDTLRHWFDVLPDWQREYIYKYMSRSVNDWKAMPELLIRLAMSTISDTVIVPAADYLGHGSEGRINFPGTSGNNWMWRMKEGAFTDSIKGSIAEIVGVYGRYQKALPKPCPKPEAVTDTVQDEEKEDKPGAAPDSSADKEQDHD
ncbi:4-alpha-glucanotransferase [Oribacterium sp. P6A1]|uniref:4-alpha-glucanotransferase n=1 Tax=Oribacterium sp. P6A1 TaxID=1410612 RepID=UPI00056657B9